MMSFEDNIFIKTYGNLSDFTPEDLRNSLTKNEKTLIGWLSAKVAHNQINQMHGRKRSATVIPNCR